jgi:hypothetical protein
LVGGLILGGAVLEADPAGLGFATCPCMPLVFGGLDEGPHGGDSWLEKPGGLWIGPGRNGSGSHLREVLVLAEPADDPGLGLVSLTESMSETSRAESRWLVGDEPDGADDLASVPVPMQRGACWCKARKR